VLLSTEFIGLLVVLAILAMGMLYAFKGSTISEQWWSWIRSACLAAVIVFGIGTLTLGLPGAIFLEVVAGSGRLPADSAWPLAIGIAQVGSLIIVPSSLALRLLAPHARGWQHAGLTALLAVVATLLFTMIMIPAQSR
jgi:hypothetical protein